MKSFKEYIAENNIAADYVAPKDSDKEATEYEPRSKGEKAFKDAHKIEKKDHPVATDDQFTGGIKGKTGEHGMPSSGNGEKKVVKQGNSPKEA
jgi:membrane protein involved in colicin uptake